MKTLFYHPIFLHLYLSSVTVDHLSVTLSLPELLASVLVALCTRGAETGDTFGDGMYCNQFGTEYLNKVKDKSRYLNTVSLIFIHMDTALDTFHV